MGIVKVPSQKTGYTAEVENGSVTIGGYPSGILGNTEAAQDQERYWLSQPAPMSDPRWEIVKVEFSPVCSINHLSFRLLQIPHNYEIWYQNDNGEEATPLLDPHGSPIKGSVSLGNDPNSWVLVEKSLTSTIVKSLEFRLQRKPVSGSPTWLLGLREILPRRTISLREDAILPLGRSVDTLGNLVTHTVKDWDARKALDGASTTFWKSSPQPVSDAVVSLYLDARTANFESQVVDALWIDPVFSGQNLNIYWCDDEGVDKETYRLTGLPADVIEQTNAEWVPGYGIRLDQSNSRWSFPTNSIAYEPWKPVRYGISWKPDFPSDNPGFTETLTLFGSADWALTYNPLTKRLTMGGGQTPALDFDESEDVNILIDNNPEGGSKISVITATGTYNPASIPDVSLGSVMRFENMEGVLANVFIQQPPSTDNGEVWFDHPNSFFDVTEKWLDNVVFGGNLGQIEQPMGGLESAFFDSLVWTPVWADFVVRKGFLKFPHPIKAKFLKLEFSNLTPQEYPIWGNGIKVQYKTYPLSVERTTTDQETVTTTTQTATRNGSVTSNKVSTNVATNTSQYDTFVNEGTVQVHTNLPDLVTKPIETDIRTEVANSLVYRNQTNWTTKQVVTKEAYYTVISGDYLIKIGQKLGMNWWDIYTANRSMIDNDYRVGLLPSRSPGWWIFPGQRLKISEEVIKYIRHTQTNTQTRKVTTTTTRERFYSTGVHKYETRETYRTVNLAYFAGLRGVKMYAPSYLTIEDQPYHVLTYRGNFGVEESDGSLSPVETVLVNGTEVVQPTEDVSLISAVWPSMSSFNNIVFTAQDAHGETFPSRDAGISVTGSFDVLREDGSVTITKTGQSCAVRGEYIPLVTGQRVRATFSAQRIGSGTSNKVTIKVLSTAGELGRQQVKIPYGSWSTTESHWFEVPKNANVRAAIEISGPDNETLVVDRVTLETSDVTYFASNDGGANFFELSNIVNKPGAKFVFPTFDTRLQVRVVAKPGTQLVGFACYPNYRE